MTPLQPWSTELILDWTLASPGVSTFYTLYCNVHIHVLHLNLLSRSFGRYNVHAKVFCWLMTVYPIVTALTGFQFTNLLPYILQVVPTVTGYYRKSFSYFFKLAPLLWWALPAKDLACVIPENDGPPAQAWIPGKKGATVKFRTIILHYQIKNIKYKARELMTLASIICMGGLTVLGAL
ncbi:hypothetical protein DSO57_1038623 [Entomophthora muscae]|uniref:Uncharacterized protein n=1 Tax=Entomophthora muscae TaxID=34485 RepID=A0ACC2RPH3_9FUNG|nr:hypothetical protein DSO57_1038623 [Entomophthora muscae]